jgi:N-acetylglutamate synthase-like GNAT family acetyltransferase
MENIVVREIKESDKNWMKEILTASWGSEIIVASKTFNALELPGFIGEIDGQVGGVLTYNIARKKLEIVSLNVTIQEKGIGSALIEKTKEVAKELKLKSVFLVTSNDNISALRFYQKRGFRITKVYPNAIDKARKLKPNIPETGNYGIPLKDALELEYKII